MKLILSHTTALQAYRADIAGFRTGVTSQSHRPRLQLIPPDFSPTITAVESEDLQSRFNLLAPLHSVCTAHSNSYRSPRVIKHFTGNLTERDTAFRLAEGLWLSCPEMLFLQMAQELELGNLVELGYELCGGYSLPPKLSLAETQYGLPPLTSAAELQAYLSSVTYRKGLAKARYAAKYVLDNSWSPMETKAAILLGLPRVKGGMGLGMPSMNHEVRLDADARSTAGKQKCYCDLFWADAKVAVEYDSTFAHDNPRSLREDSLRRDALRRMGIEVLTLTDMQVYDKQKFDAFVHTLAKCLGKRLTPKSAKMANEEIKLRRLLLGNSRL